MGRTGPHDNQDKSPIFHEGGQDKEDQGKPRLQVTVVMWTVFTVQPPPVLERDVLRKAGIEYLYVILSN